MLTMDKFKIIFLIICALLNVSCSLNLSSDNTSNHGQSESGIKYSYADLNDVYSNAVDSIMSHKRFHVCIDSFPEEIEGNITVICEVYLDSNLYILNKTLFIRHKNLEEKKDNEIDKILTPTYKKLYYSQEEFTDSILKRVNNLSLLNSGRLHHVDIAKQYVFTFVYYLVDCDE